MMFTAASPSLDALRAALAPVVVSTRALPGHAPLLDAIQAVVSSHGHPPFVARLSRGGWYRPGRILAPDDSCVAEDAGSWLEQAWEAADGDAGALLDQHADKELRLTRIIGHSHYFVAPTGERPTDFVQLEVEELQEVESHPLNAHDADADSAEDLLEPPADAPKPRPLAPPRYHFRRLANIAECIQQIHDQPGKPAPVLRFLDDWAASSAGQQRRFCDHWVLALSEHLDRYHQTRYGAVPVAAHHPAWQGDPNAHGLELAQHLHDFDRAAGYGFAWYFHMVAGRRVPRNLTAAVFNDLQGEMAYLPERDAKLVAQWMEVPYAL